MRRRIYEIIRLELPKFAGIYDVAVIVTSGEVLGLESPELKTQIVSMLERAGLYENHTTSGTIEVNNLSE